MATNSSSAILKERLQFVQHLDADLNRQDDLIQDAIQRLNDLEVTSQNVTELNKKVEHQCLIPLGKNIFVNGTIIHTGEYYLDKKAFPNSYSILETASGTIRHLDKKIEQQSQFISEHKKAKEQIEEKRNLLQGHMKMEETDNNDYPVEDLSDLPKEIISDKGVAVKLGDYYEIFEYEN